MIRYVVTDATSFYAFELRFSAELPGIEPVT
jgi:hypothetical protein